MGDSILVLAGPQHIGAARGLGAVLGRLGPAEVVVPADGDQAAAAVARHQTIWLEGAGQVAAFVTKAGQAHLAGKRVLCRVLGREAWDGGAAGLDLAAVDDLVAAGPGLLRPLAELCAGLGDRPPRLHVIPPALPNPPAAQPRVDHNKVAVLGELDFGGEMGLLLHLILAVHRRLPHKVFHLGGQNLPRADLQRIQAFARLHGLEQTLRLEPLKQGLAAWAADKGAVLTATAREAAPPALLECLALGCRPLTPRGLGEEGLWPEMYTYGDAEELASLLANQEPPALHQAVAAQCFGPDAVAPLLAQALEGRQEVRWPGCRPPDGWQPSIPQGCFSQSLSQRRQANRAHGLALAQQGRLEEARVFLERAFAQGGFRRRDDAEPLLACLAKAGHWAEVGNVFKQLALQAARHGDLNALLDNAYLAYYGAYMHTRDYRHMVYDPALDAALALTAPSLSPLAPPAQTPPKGAPVAALGIEGFDYNQAPIKQFVELGLGLAQAGLGVVFISRLDRRPEDRATLTRLEDAGCLVADLGGGDQVQRLRRALGLLRQLGPKALICQSPWLIPWLNLLAMCRPAPCCIKVPNQPGGWETNYDHALVSNPQAVIDLPQEGLFLGTPLQGDPPAEARPRPRARGELKALIVGRPPALRADRRFWQALELALARTPGLEIDVAGATAQDMADMAPANPRLRFHGFRTDIVAMMLDRDVVINTWPYGGGGVLLEACQAGRPVLSYRADWRRHQDTYFSTMETLVTPDMLLDRFEPEAVAALLGRLADEPGFLERVTAQCLELPMVSPQEQARRLAEFIRELP